jgi:hypothetical protein
VQKNLCDFFFFVVRVPSVATLSSSEPSSSSLSESSISTSSDSRDFAEYREFPRLSAFLSSGASGAETGSGSGRCDDNAPKLVLVGVFASSSFADEAGGALGPVVGLGVVAVASSP